MKFLIVDDSPAMQTIVRRSLEQTGYVDHEVRMANDGEQALYILEQWEPDLVITDWHMPNMSGIELLREMENRGMKIKAGLVTTETDPKRILEAKQAGSLFVIHKPFQIDQFRKTILPIMQGAVEGEHLLTDYNPELDTTVYELQLPNLTALNKILDGFTIKSLHIEQTEQNAIDYSYLPYVLALFSDLNTEVIKAVCILDIRAAVILGCAFDNAPDSDVQAALEFKALDKHLLDNIKRLMKMVSALFYDPNTQQDLDLKSVHLIPKPFDRLDQLGSSSSNKRLDLKICAEGYGEGQAILMAVAE